MNPGEKQAAHALVAVIAALGLIGAVLSFAKVQAAMEPSFGDLAPLVPIGVDVGIAAFTGLDLLMTRMDMRTRWLRLVPWLLVGVTIYLNVSGEAKLEDQVAHGAMPALWVVAVEAGASSLRKWAGLHSTTQRMDRVRPSRWLLAPTSTLRLWRRMILWEIRSYPDALKRERDRLLALCDLQDQHGRMWRWKANRRDRALYRLGELVPSDVLPSATPIAAPVPKQNGDLTAAADAIATELGKAPSRRVLMERLGIGTAKASELARRYR